jgi:hypothetical protein
MKCNAQSGFSSIKAPRGHRPCPKKAENFLPVPPHTQIGNWSCGMTWHIMLTNRSKMSTIIINLFCNLLSINHSFFTTTTTMAPTCITVFRPFNLQHDRGENFYIQLQEVIYYGESRFWAAMAGIIRAAVKHHGWMQMCLQQEVV